MSDRNFKVTQLGVGEIAPQDVRDANGMLLLREGRAATSEAQLKTLLRNAVPTRAAAPPIPDPKYRPASPLAMALGARRQLQALCREPVDFPAQLERIVQQLRKACRMNADVVLAAILLCDEEPYAFRHAVNVAAACAITATALEWSDETIASTVAAALCMNIAMTDLQEWLVARRGSLSAEQHAAVHAHPIEGARMLREYGIVDPLTLEIVADHHEALDGSGYPAGKRGAALNAATQLVSLADIYCARVSARLYRSAMAPNLALRWLFVAEDRPFDERLAMTFIKAFGVYPPGTAVRLRNRSVGIVTQRGPSAERPRVSSITSMDGMRLAIPIRRSGDLPGHAVTEVVDLEALGLVANMEALWGADAVL